METESIALGKKIKRYRLINDIRQEDMAEKMGVSRATLINYEKGYTSINMDVLDRLKNYYPDFDAESYDTDESKPKIIVDNTINFKVLFKILQESKKHVIFFYYFFCFFGITSSYLFKKQYQAEISLYPAKNDGNQGISQLQAIVANVGLNNVNGDQSFNIPDVVESRLIASKAVRIEWIDKNNEKIKLITLWNLDKKPGITFVNQKSGFNFNL